MLPSRMVAALPLVEAQPAALIEVPPVVLELWAWLLPILACWLYLIALACYILIEPAVINFGAAFFIIYPPCVYPYVELPPGPAFDVVALIVVVLLLESMLFCVWIDAEGF